MESNQVSFVLRKIIPEEVFAVINLGLTITRQKNFYFHVSSAPEGAGWFVFFSPACKDAIRGLQSRKSESPVSVSFCGYSSYRRCSCWPGKG